MSERSTGSQYDRDRVNGQGEQRRQQNQQSNQAGGQQGSTGGSFGAGPMKNARDAGLQGAAVPGHEGLAEQENQGLAQADPAKSVGPQRVEQARDGGAVERGGTASAPGDANGSGSMGSTRRDDSPRNPRR